MVAIWGPKCPQVWEVDTLNFCRVFKGPFQLIISVNAVMLLAISLWLNCLDFLINQASRSKNGFNPNWSDIKQALTLTLQNQSLTLNCKQALNHHWIGLDALSSFFHIVGDYDDSFTADDISWSSRIDWFYSAPPGGWSRDPHKETKQRSGIFQSVQTSAHPVWTKTLMQFGGVGRCVCGGGVDTNLGDEPQKQHKIILNFFKS